MRHKNKPLPIHLDAATIRRMCVRGSVDPRTLLAVAAGEPAKGLARERARAVLLAEGYPLPERGRR